MARTRTKPAAVREAPTSPAAPRTLDELLELEAPELEALYHGAGVPQIADLTGDLRGRMLAIPAVRGVPARAVRAFARSDRFPWRGKSFQDLAPDRGEGRNRVILDRWKLYRFETSVGRSLAGEFDAVLLDYDLPENPFFIRAIKDEVRELSPGLWLGQAWVRAGKRPPILGLYFGLSR